ncbi:MAG: C40 family peptidase [Negativicutes bacterium]|nr:C40 family peptidase [Negativicutes bacterium]
MEQEARQPVFGAINVPFAIFWSDPGKPEYENISLRASSQPSKWAESLDVARRLWLVDKVNTMAIFGERVVILDRQGDWLNIAAVVQRTRDNRWGQVGWVPADQVSQNGSYLKEQLCRPEAVIIVPRATLFQDACLTQPLGTLGFQVRLPVLAESQTSFTLRLPDGGCGYLTRGEGHKAADLCFSRKNIVDAARQFLGLRYLWGGTSIYGYDCSGFTFRLYQSQGIYLPRNSKQQSQEGFPVGRKSLATGDLLFFATENGKGYIHHVAMYAADGMMIHSPESKDAIKESRVDDEPYRQEYWGARRYAV